MNKEMICKEVVRNMEIFTYSVTADKELFIQDVNKVLKSGKISAEYKEFVKTRIANYNYIFESIEKALALVVMADKNVHLPLADFPVEELGNDNSQSMRWAVDIHKKAIWLAEQVPYCDIESLISRAEKCENGYKVLTALFNDEETKWLSKQCSASYSFVMPFLQACR